MDAFSTIEFDLASPSSFPTFAAERSEDETIRELVDADAKMGYGGYCVVA